MEFSDFKTTVSSDDPGHGFAFDSNDGMLPFSARSHRMDVFLRKNPNPFSSGIYWTVVVKGHGLPQVQAEGRYLNEARAEAALKLLSVLMDS